MARGMPSEFWTQRVHLAMDHVRDHPGGDLRLATLAGVANASPYHFHRIFKAVAGETPAEFARRSRLERAAYLMKARPDRRLSSVALDVGFPALAEFSRAFKRQYGISPSAWNRRSRLDSVVGCNPAAGDAAVRAAGTTRRGSGGVGLAQPTARLVERAACRLVYTRMRTWFRPDILKTGYGRLTAWLEARGIKWRELELVGMSWDHYETTPLDQVHYDLAFVVPHAVEAEGEMGIYELPAFRAVEVHCEGELAGVAAAWDYLYEVWLPASRYEPADLPAMKRFRRRPDEIGWDSWDLDCSIALRRAAP